MPTVNTPKIIKIFNKQYKNITNMAVFCRNNFLYILYSRCSFKGISLHIFMICNTSTFTINIESELNNYIEKLIELNDKKKLPKKMSNLQKNGMKELFFLKFMTVLIQ